MPHPMRRADREITSAEEIDRLLATGRFYTAALADDGHPYLVTLSYGYDAETRRLYAHAAREGRKFDVIAANPEACATVIHDLGYEEGECAHQYASVVLFGRMRVVDDAEEARHGMRVLIGRLESDADAVWARQKLDRESTWRRLSILAFDIEHVTAKRGS